MYLVKSNWLLKKWYSSCVWSFPDKDKKVYLTFDDGPHPTATPFVLEQLKAFEATATFFCIGKNVAEHPDIYTRILMEGHTVGNHTMHHLNGWKVSDKEYFDDILRAKEYIDSKMFRPPYGKISQLQLKYLQSHLQLTPIMWSVLSGDFDDRLSPEKCLQNVLLNVKPGNIIVFHDSEKAWKRLSYSLPKLLKYLTDEGYQINSINL